ncbi:MAG: hypothetical protein WC557_10335 [Ignavibacteriaceae bacterium]
MTQHEENKFNMYNATDAILKSNVSIIAEVPALGEVHTDLQSLIEQIETKNSELMKATEGKTSVKSKSINELISSIVPIASAVKAYSVRNKLLELKAKSDFTESDFKHLTHVELPVKVKSIRDGAQDVLASLAGYGITQAKLDVVDARLAAMKTAAGNKDVGFTDRSATREALTQLFDKTDGLLKDEADAIVEVVKESQPDFYNRYFSARVIKDLGGSHTKPGDEGTTPPPTPPAQ